MNDLLNQRPSKESIREIQFTSVKMTIAAGFLCGLLYLVSEWVGQGDVNKSSAFFTRAFQSLLIIGWCLIVWPYIRVTLMTMLFGINLSEKTAKFFSEPKDSPLVQHLQTELEAQRLAFERKLDQVAIDFKQEAGKIRDEISSLTSGPKKPLVDPLAGRKFVLPEVQQHVGQGNGT